MIPPGRTHRPARNSPRRGVGTCIALAVLSLAAATNLAAQQILWQYSGPTGAEFFSSAAIASDGYFIVGTSGGLPQSATNRAIRVRRNVRDGIFELGWSVQLPDWVDSSPALSADEQTAYVGCWDGRLYALNMTNGATRWSFLTGGYITGSPAVAADGTIYFGSADGILYALNPDGSLRWFVPVLSEMETSPSIAPDGSVIVGTMDGRVVAVRADGTLKWEFEAEDVPGEDKRILAAPAIGPNGTVYIGSGNGRLYAIDFAGRLLWGVASPEPVDSSPVVGDDGTVYFANRLGYLTALDEDGFEIWSVFLGDIFFSSPVLDRDGNVYVVAFSGNNASTLYCFDMDGLPRFTTSLPTVVDASPTIWTSVVNQIERNTLIVGGYNGVVYGIRALAPLASTPWPKFGRDLTKTARADTGPPPELLAAPLSGAVPVGAALSLRALGNGSEFIAYRWFRNGVELPGADQANLHLGMAGAAHPGGYVCRILNPFGEVESPTAWIAVTEPPSVAGSQLDWRMHVPAGSGAPAATVEAATHIGVWSPVATQLESTSTDGSVETRRAQTQGNDRAFLRLHLGP